MYQNEFQITIINSYVSMLIAANLHGFNPENPITNFTISENQIPYLLFSSLASFSPVSRNFLL